MTAPRRRVLVTGGAGYVGNAVCDRLVRDGHRVTVVDNLRSPGSIPPPSTPRHAPVEFVLGDARLGQFIAPLISDADAVVPLAALVGDDVDREPTEARSVNVEAIEMLRQLLHPDQLLVHVGHHPLDRTARGDSLDGSARDPRSLESTLAQEAEHQVQRHPRSIVLRVGDLFGPSRAHRRDLIVHRIVQTALDRGVVSAPDPGTPLSPLHVDDLAAAVVRCIDRPVAPSLPALNLGSARPRSVGELARLVATALALPPGENRTPEGDRATGPGRRIDLTAARLAGIEPARRLADELDALIAWLRTATPPPRQER